MSKGTINSDLKGIYRKWRTSEENFFERLKIKHEFKKLTKEEKKLAMDDFSDFAKLEEPINEDDFSALEEEYLGIPRISTTNL
ncbi:hypothetical protein [Clostridium sp. B9]|uniref:hypothetical protein n=1 Tax=Clostridium sp. B9 TaxID=3423224 RepID=UPI003D2EE63C